MNSELRRSLEAQLRRSLPESDDLRWRSAAGGDSHPAWILDGNRGQRFFLKASAEPAVTTNAFTCEARSLEALRKAGAIRVPGVLAASEHPPLLLLEYIVRGHPGPDFSARFGRAFALLHQTTAGDRFGWPEDNWIGRTPQANRWCDRWLQFVREHRLGFQLRLLEETHPTDVEIQRSGHALLNGLERWLGDSGEPPVLLHGDLWSGNYLVDAGGQPVLIDPASYYGRREMDLAMTRLFGGFDQEFYRSYDSVWPLPPGSRERLGIYQLYHLLNHYNLFGVGYRSACLTILRELVGTQHHLC